MRGRGDISRTEAQQEVELMTKVRDHPNIIKYYDHWFGDRGMFILMEYAPNGSLHEAIHHHRTNGMYFTGLQVQHYLQELATAVTFLHDEVRMMHRDLKPENVLIGRFGELKLADFGLSKALAPGNDLCATFVGSPLYMSPELCNGEEYSFSTDIWAFGCIMYEIMTLHSPWEAACFGGGANTIPALLKKISSDRPDFQEMSKLYPTRVVNTVRWMLHKTPTHRPTAAALLELLEIREPPVQEHILRDTVILEPAPLPPMCAPPPPMIAPLPPVYVPPPPSAAFPAIGANNTLLRQQELVQEAANLVQAATRIQTSFRASRNRYPAAPQPLRPMDKMRDASTQRVPASNLAQPPDTTDTNATVVIQRALRRSLNRRYPAGKIPQPRLRTAAPITTKPPAPVQPVPQATRLQKPQVAASGVTRPSSANCRGPSARLVELAIPRQPRIPAVPPIPRAPLRVNKGAQASPRPAWM